MSDYSIRRRRVRHNYCFKPVDPCLGFYTRVHETKERHASNEQLEGALDHPSQQPDWSNTEKGPFSPPPMTVERFLRRNRKKYDRQRGRTTQATSRPGSKPESTTTLQGPTSNPLRLRNRVVGRTINEDSSDSSVSGREEGEELAPPRRTGRKKRNYGYMRRPLHDRLFEALVSTYGDPDDCLARPHTNKAGDTHDTRKPLRFVPAQQDLADDEMLESTSRQDMANVPRRKGWALVDPRKSTAMRSATFAAAERASCKGTMNITDGWPIRKWKEENTFHQISVQKSTRPKPRITAKASAIDDRPARVPLTFVELTPSGDYCQTRQSTARVGGFPLSEAGLPGEGTKTHLQSNGRGRQLNAPGAAQPLAFVPVSRPAWHGTRHEVFETTTSQDRLLNSDSPVSSCTPGHQTSPFPGRVGQAPSVHLRPLTRKGQDCHLASPFTSSSPTRHVGQHKRSGIHKTPVSPPRFTKPLRPLGSLFDGFIENIKHTATRQATILDGDCTD